jgi:hypothetical protein
MSTFIVSALIPYEDFVSSTVISNAMTFKLPDLKKNVQL